MKITFTVTLEAEKSEIVDYMKTKNMAEDMLDVDSSVLQLSDFEDADFFELSTSHLTAVE